jgi:hypothetical protein
VIVGAGYGGQISSSRRRAGMPSTRPAPRIA